MEVGPSASISRAGARFHEAPACEEEEEEEPPLPPKPRTPRRQRSGRLGRGLVRKGTGGECLREEPAIEDKPEDEEEEIECAPPLKEPLKKAVGILTKVHPLLAKVANEQEAAAERHSAEGAAPGEGARKVATKIARSMERLQAVRRKLEEAIEIVEAEGEDELLEVILRHHEKLLRLREKAEAQIQNEQKHVKGVRWDITELQRNMLRSKHTHDRFGVGGSAERLDEFRRVCTNVEGVHENLTQDLRSISDALIAQLRRNGNIDENIQQLHHARDIAKEENAKAKQLLASGETVDVYRRAKEREKAAINADFAQAQAECNAEMTRLQEGWSMTQSKYTQDLLELRTQVRSIQRLLDEKSREAEQTLGKQSIAWSKCADDVGKQIARGFKAREDLRKEKSKHLHEEVLRSRRVEKDMAAGTQRRLQAQINEVKLQCMNQLKMEEIRLNQELQADKLAVDDARKNAGVWAQRAESMREAYRGHAYKSGAYRLAMEVETLARAEKRRPMSASWES